MSSHLQRLTDRGLIQPPKWLPVSVVYEVMTGSFAYGVSSDSSDRDVYGIAIPPKADVFPHLKGEIAGFGRQKQNFEQYQQHHVSDKDAIGGSGCMYDFTIYNVVKFFTLAAECNPNIVDCLFVPQTCILYSNQVGQHIRENRHKFLNKKAYHTFKGYAYSQLHKIKSGRSAESIKRKELIEQHGYDTKFAYHIFRLIDEVEQILTLGDIDLQRARELMKSVRRGDFTIEQVDEYFQMKEKTLEQLYRESDLPHSPDEATIKQVLIDCLEMHYGSLENCVQTGVNLHLILNEIDERLGILRKNLV